MSPEVEQARLKQKAKSGPFTDQDQIRFEAKFIPEPNSGCWLWVGAIHPHGYGLFRCERFAYNTSRAHAFAYELYKGPRNGFSVLHTCDVRCCVNPDHLWLGTYKDNARDRDKKQRRRAPKGTLNGRCKLTVAQVLEIHRDPRRKTDIARAYGVGFTVVHDIKIGRSWKHIPR